MCLGRSVSDLGYKYLGRTVQRVRSRDICAWLWARTTVKQMDGKLILAWLRRVSMSKEWGLSNTAWAFTTVKLFTGLFTALLWRLSDFNAQGLYSTIWTVTTVKQSDKTLLIALLERIDEDEARRYSGCISGCKRGRQKSQGFKTRHEIIPDTIHDVCGSGRAFRTWCKHIQFTMRAGQGMQAGPSDSR